MVLNANNSKPRTSSNAQPLSPRASSSRSIAHRRRSSVEAVRLANMRARPTSSEASPTNRARRGEANSIDEEPPIVTHASDEEIANFSSTRITLVRRLARPQFQNIDPEKIAAVDENLVEVPLDIVKMDLDLMSPVLVQSFTSATVIHTEVNNSSRDVNVLVTRLTTIFPSHVLVVTGPGQPGANPLKAQYYPVHSLVLATQCANMPVFPPSPTISIDHEQDTQEIKLPVQVISVPDQATFSVLLRYLYGKEPMQLIKDLMPVRPPDTLLQSPSQASQYASTLAVALKEDDLLGSAALVKGLWQNVCALLIDDETLWCTIDLMWEAVVSALTIRQQRS